ncbi:metal ABC transporter solute-binding protein, Zn/Mn family, partial [Xylanibacillus composti]|uniref:metal ABC transporter solute-binding protein, Zn/Mn family n=1 Tax=Xylanibacillus composti TaxID=1572762 RepID=UPI001BD187C9
RARHEGAEADDHGHAHEGAEADDHGHEHEGAEADDHGHEHEEDAHGHSHGHDHDHGGYDPHAWVSPLSAKKMAEQILQALIEVDPDHAEDYRANYEQIAAQFDELDEELRAIIAAGNRTDIVVSHHAYGYLERDYGLVQLAVMGISPESEPTPQDMKNITQYVQEHGVQYILFEELASPRIAEILAQEAGVETLVFNPVEGLTEEQEKAGEDYFTVMKRNLTSLEKALQ